MANTPGRAAVKRLVQRRPGQQEVLSRKPSAIFWRMRVVRQPANVSAGQAHMRAICGTAPPTSDLSGFDWRLLVVPVLLQTWLWTVAWSCRFGVAAREPTVRISCSI